MSDTAESPETGFKMNWKWNMIQGSTRNFNADVVERDEYTEQMAKSGEADRKEMKFDCLFFFFVFWTELESNEVRNERWDWTNNWMNKKWIKRRSKD